MRERLEKHFKVIEKNNAEIPDAEKVTVKLSRRVQLQELRRIYSNNEKEHLIFDKEKMKGQKNQCGFHISDK